MLESKELDKFLAKMSKSPEEIKKGMAESVQKAGELIKVEAQNIVPVDTGFLRDHIQSESMKDEIRIGVDTSLVPYAAHIEDRVLFLDQALSSKEAQAVQIIGDGFFEAVAKATEEAANG